MSDDFPRKAVLGVEDLYLGFGGVQALAGVDLEVREGEILAIIGPNGAGKTSLLNCINGFYHPQRGTIRFEGQDITKLPAHRIATLGIARAFQNIALYSGLRGAGSVSTSPHRRT